MRVNNAGVHASHCCIKHGCKYGNAGCPVVRGQIEQEYLCEECEADDQQNLTDGEELARLYDIERKYLRLLAKYNELLMQTEDDWR